MNPISSLSAYEDCYKLSQEAFTYKGDCSICARGMQNLYSMHQIEGEIYDEEVHGPIIASQELQGVKKSIDVAITIKNIVHTVSKSVFHQIGLGSDLKLHLFLPSHNACLPCIEKIKKFADAKCPICRFELPKVLPKDEPTPSKTSFDFLPRTKRYFESSIKASIACLDNKDKHYTSLPRSQKKCVLNEITKYCNKAYSAADILDAEYDEAL